MSANLMSLGVAMTLAAYGTHADPKKETTQKTVSVTQTAAAFAAGFRAPTKVNGNTAHQVPGRQAIASIATKQAKVMKLSSTGSQRESARRAILQVGLLKALDGSDGATARIFGPGGLSGELADALAGLKGDIHPGEARAVGALGSRGMGAGGERAALVIGSLGTKGMGPDRGGYGDMELGARGKVEAPVASHVASHRWIAQRE